MKGVSEMRRVAGVKRAGAVVLATAVLQIASGCAADRTPSVAEEAASAPAEEAPEASAASHAAIIPEDAVRIGESITVASAPVRLAEVRADPTAYFEKTLLVQATAEDVCQAKGCWMTITDGAGEPIWVRWASGCGGAYAFPKDAAGKQVLLQGSFYPKEISAVDAEHLAAESQGMKAGEIAGETFEINATACVVLPAES